MMEAKKIDYISFGLFMGIVSAIISFVVAALTLLFNPLLYISTPGMMPPMGSWLSGVAALSLVVSPISGFIFGFISGLIAAFLYNNLLIRWIKVKFE